MKKLIFIFAGLFLMANVTYSQIDDRAVIPVAITLNSILRLNVTSGGNIEFNFNTLNDYENGIAANAAYQTKFNVASSVNWNVLMYAEDANLVGTDIISVGGADPVNANIMSINNIGYHISSEGSLGDSYSFTSNDPAAPVALTALDNTIAVGFDATPNAGDINKNSFTIHWRCGTNEGGGMNTESILTQGIAADRYATNVFLILQPAN